LGQNKISLISKRRRRKKKEGPGWAGGEEGEQGSA